PPLTNIRGRPNLSPICPKPPAERSGGWNFACWRNKGNKTFLESTDPLRYNRGGRGRSIMRVFPHGNVVNFQACVREMFSADLERLPNRWSEGTSVLTGAIEADQGVLHLYGRIRDVEIDEQGDRFAIRFRDMENQADREAVRSYEKLSISHEAHFDIEDPDRG